MKIYCYGDSNTYGYDPRDFMGRRYDLVWTDIVEAAGHQVIVNAMPGRQIPFRKRPLDIMHDQFEEHFDLLIIMMGSNDLDATHDVGTVTGRMESLLKAVESWNVTDRILLVGPPANRWSKEIERLSADMNEAYERLAKDRCVEYVDAGGWNFEMAFDRCHLTENDQHIFAEELLKVI